MKPVLIAFAFLSLIACTKEKSCVTGPAKMTEISANKYRITWASPGDYVLHVGPSSKAGYGVGVEFLYNFDSAQEVRIEVISDCGGKYEKSF
jgi:hypothetical protein